jgi:hypothetical protein
LEEEGRLVRIAPHLDRVIAVIPTHAVYATHGELAVAPGPPPPPRASSSSSSSGGGDDEYDAVAVATMIFAFVAAPLRGGAQTTTRVVILDDGWRSGTGTGTGTGTGDGGDDAGPGAPYEHWDGRASYMEQRLDHDKNIPMIVPR